MLLKDVSFRNYKSFGNSDQGRIQDLSKIDLIFGHNSSGKSNILKFLTLLFSRKLIRQTINVEGAVQIREERGSFYEGTITNQPYIFHKNQRKTPIKFDVSIELTKEEFENSGFENHATIVGKYFKKSTNAIVKIEGTITSSGDPYTSTIKLDKVSLAGTDIYTDTGKKKTYFGEQKDLGLDSADFENFMGLFNEIIFFLDKDRYLVAEKENQDAKQLYPHTFKNWLHNLSLDGHNYKRYDDFIDFVKKYGSPIDVLKIFAPRFTKSPDGDIDVTMSNGSDYLPVSSFGTGTQQILLLLAMIFDTQAKIILVEELELNLSPRSQQHLLLIFSTLLEDKKIDQVILTSHSEILASTPDIKAFEVSMDGGVSSVKNVEEASADDGGGRDTKFFERDADIDAQMKKSYIPHPPGDEWEK